eukprot:TRINITY_DN10920_c0_g1_i1.p2 TRINITY_DN10920_c0_g1~~TRINITY_DN10920_c0_g1_i1.p2  ORF type:complete len:115 (-),score=14.00 TRINITY_DN10920_c0_g1_i1:77-421(-)
MEQMLKRSRQQCENADLPAESTGWPHCGLHAANEENVRIQELERRLSASDEGPSRAPASGSAQVGDVVLLNVGGSPYCTTRSSLTKFRDTMLGAMFSGQYALNTDRDGRVFLDR